MLSGFTYTVIVMKWHNDSDMEKRGKVFPRFSMSAYSVSCTISSYSRMCFLSIARLAW